MGARTSVFVKCIRSVGSLIYMNIGRMVSSLWACASTCSVS